MHFKISNLLLVSLTLSVPLGSLARALPNPVSISVRSVEASDNLQSGHVLKRVDVVEPEPESEGPETTEPGSTTPEPDPTNPQSTNPQDVPDPDNVAGAGTGPAPPVQAPSDPITGAPLTGEQAAARGTTIVKQMGDIPAGTADKATPDMSAYTFDKLPAMDTQSVNNLGNIFGDAELKFSDFGTFQRIKVSSNTAPNLQGTESADAVDNGILQIDVDVEQNLLIVPWMNKIIDGNPTADQNFVSDLLKQALTELAGNKAGSLEMVMQQDIKNTATREIIQNLTPGKSGKPVTFGPNDAGWSKLMGNDNVMVTNRMLLDYPEFFGHKTAQSITTFWRNGEDSSASSDSDGEDVLDIAHMWITYK